ncbi:MAG: response regulator [Candidatus Spechtbacterales bacterium]|nr:response regulator [Candidatus Spechtbacterales bacterium]
MSGEKNKLILIIDDDPMMSRLFQVAISNADMDVILAPNADKGFEKLRKEKPDLLVLDLLLPGKNGIEILEEMRSDESIKNIPVIIFSSLDKDEYIDKLKELNIVDFVIKSDIHPRQLVEKIQQYFSKNE